MSLRDKLKNALVTTGAGTVASTPSGSLSSALRQAGGSVAVAKPTGRGLEAVKNADARLPGVSATGFIGFVIDATGSRSATWAQAQEIQARMFEKVASYGAMTLRLVHFGGSVISDLGWERNSDTVTSHMAEVSCIGGSTQILASLQKFIEDQKAAKSIILIGDAFEESVEAIPEIAATLKARGTKVFSFLEGGSEGAAKAFQMLAEQTGGAFAEFGKDMPLQDLCEGVALMSIGGASALERLQNANVKTLLLTARR